MAPTTATTTPLPFHPSLTLDLSSVDAKTVPSPPGATSEGWSSQDEIPEGWSPQEGGTRPGSTSGPRPAANPAALSPSPCSATSPVPPSTTNPIARCSASRVSRSVTSPVPTAPIPIISSRSTGGLAFEVVLDEEDDNGGGEGWIGGLSPRTGSGGNILSPRLHRRLSESSLRAIRAEDIKEKLRNAEAKRQRFLEWLSDRARPKVRSPLPPSPNESMAQKIEAKLSAAEAKRLELLEIDRARLSSYHNRLLHTLRERRAAAAGAAAAAAEASVLARIRRAEEKRTALLDAERARAGDRVAAVRETAAAVLRDRAHKSEVLHARLVARLKAAKERREELLAARAEGAAAAAAGEGTAVRRRAVQGERLSRALARCWRQFVATGRTTAALATNFIAVGLDRQAAASMSFEEFATLLMSPATLKAAKTLLARLELRFCLSSGHDNSTDCYRLLKRLSTTSRRSPAPSPMRRHTPSPSLAAGSTPPSRMGRLSGAAPTAATGGRDPVSIVCRGLRGTVGGAAAAAVDRGSSGSGAGGVGPLAGVISPGAAAAGAGATGPATASSVAVVTMALERYPVRVFLCAYMVTAHPEAVFNVRGPREKGLAEAAQRLVPRFEALVAALADKKGAAADGSAKDTPPSTSFPSHLADFDSAWLHYLDQFVVWKVKDAETLEQDLIRMAVQLETSMLKKVGVMHNEPIDHLSHDHAAIHTHVARDVALLRDRVGSLSGAAGLARLEAALADVRQSYLDGRLASPPTSTASSPRSSASTPPSSPPSMAGSPRRRFSAPSSPPLSPTSSPLSPSPGNVALSLRDMGLSPIKAFRSPSAAAPPGGTGLSPAAAAEGEGSASRPRTRRSLFCFPPPPAATGTGPDRSGVVPVLSAGPGTNGDPAGVSSPAKAKVLTGTAEEAPTPPTVAANVEIVHALLYDATWQMPSAASDSDPDREASPVASTRRSLQATMQAAFWDVLAQDLRSAPPKWERLVSLVRDIGQELESVAPTSMRPDIHDRIDADLLAQVLEASFATPSNKGAATSSSSSSSSSFTTSGGADRAIGGASNAMATTGLAHLRSLLEYMAETVLQLGAPVRDEKQRAAVTALLAEVDTAPQAGDGTGGRDGDGLEAPVTEAVVKGLRYLLDTVKVLKRDISNAYLRALSPLLSGPSGIAYERNWFMNKFVLAAPPSTPHHPTVTPSRSLPVAPSHSSAFLPDAAAGPTASRSPPGGQAEGQGPAQGSGSGNGADAVLTNGEGRSAKGSGSGNGSGSSSYPPPGMGRKELKARLPRTATWLAAIGPQIQRVRQETDTALASAVATTITNPEPPKAVVLPAMRTGLGRESVRARSESGPPKLSAPETGLVTGSAAGSVDWKRVETWAAVGLLEIVTGPTGATSSLPETLLLDQLRLHSLQNSYQRLLVQATSLLLLTQTIAARRPKPAPSPGPVPEPVGGLSVAPPPNPVVEAARVGHVVAAARVRLSTLLDDPSVVLRSIAELLAGAVAEATRGAEIAAESDVESMTRLLTRATSVTDPLFTLVSRSISAALLASVLLPDTHPAARQATAAALRRAGAGQLVDECLEVAAGVRRVAEVNCRVHSPLYVLMSQEERV